MQPSGKRGQPAGHRRPLAKRAAPCHCLRVRAHVFSLRTAPFAYPDLRSPPALELMLAGDGLDAAVDVARLDRLEIELDDGRIVWKRTPSEALPPLLDALRRAIAAHALLEPALPGTLLRVREAMELRLESESDIDADTFDELVLQLCERLEGFSVWRHGIFDGLGRALIDVDTASGQSAGLEWPPEPRAWRAQAPTAVSRPDATATVTRARALCALARRGLLEAAGPTPETTRGIETLRAFCEAPPVRDGLTPEEATLMALNPGAWSQRTLVEATWATETVVALAWALGLADFPGDEEMVESEPLYALFEVGEPVSERLAAARLRSPAEIRLRLEGARFVHAEALRALADDVTTMRFSSRGLDHLSTVAALAASRLRGLEWLSGA